MDAWPAGRRRERLAEERLRLVGGGPKQRGGRELGVVDDVNMGVDFQGFGDPRWVLAVKAGELLEGTMMRPERRETLILKGKGLGLSAFDANLVVAIVQDQARRGYRPEMCAGAGSEQLKMIPLPKMAGFRVDLRGRRGCIRG